LLGVDIGRGTEDVKKALEASVGSDEEPDAERIKGMISEAISSGGDVDVDDVPEDVEEILEALSSNEECDGHRDWVRSWFEGEDRIELGDRLRKKDSDFRERLLDEIDDRDWSNFPRDRINV
jgi:hypothetical protein